jgi:hypothetical protein
MIESGITSAASLAFPLVPDPEHEMIKGRRRREVMLIIK